MYRIFSLHLYVYVHCLIFINRLFDEKWALEIHCIIEFILITLWIIKCVCQVCELPIRFGIYDFWRPILALLGTHLLNWRSEKFFARVCIHINVNGIRLIWLKRINVIWMRRLQHSDSSLFYCFLIKNFLSLVSIAIVLTAVKILNPHVREVSH